MKHVLRLVFLIAAYVGAARLGLSLDAIGGFATLVWAPSGIALASLLRFGPALWPGVFLGAFIVNSWTGAAVPVALGIALGNTLEAVLAAFALRRLRFDASLESLRDVALLVGVAALATTGVSASMGATSLLLGGVIDGATFLATLRAWWLGDLIGDLIVAPLLLTFSEPARTKLAPTRLREVALLAAVTLVGGAFVFAGPPVALLGAFRQPFLLFIPLMWGALRFGMRGATATIGALSLMALYGTAQGLGPFVRSQLHESLAHLQVFMAISSIAILTLCASSEERKRALVAQEQGHRLLRAVIEGTTDAVFVKDRLGRYALINSAGARFLGLAPEHVLGKDDRALFPPATAHSITRGDQAIMESGEARTLEEPVMGAHGMHVFLSTKAPYLDEQGKVAGIIGVCRDITARKNLEEAQGLLADLAPVLAQAFDHEAPFGRIAALLVERKVAERCVFEVAADTKRTTHASGPELTGTLHQRSYALEARGHLLGSMTLQSNAPLSMLAQEVGHEVAQRVCMAMESSHLYRVACEAVRARDEFLSIASHELRTPLSSLVLNLSYMSTSTARKGSDLEDTRSRIERAVRQTDKLTRLVDSLLDVSRVNAGQLYLQCEDTDLGELTAEVAARFADQTTAEGRIELQTRGPLLGRWDRLRLEQVITNLLSNALKYGGGKPVLVSLEGGTDTVRLSVKDQGMGIAADDLPRLFERYQRAAAARRIGGLGLGLFIARQIVEAHGGRIVAHSTRGQGSVFTVELPRLCENQTFEAKGASRPRSNPFAS